MRFKHVLRCGDQRQAHHGALGQLIEQRVDRVALARFAGEMACGRWRAQAVGDHDPVRYAVEVPQPRVGIRAWLAKEQPLRKVPATGQLDLVGLRRLRIGRQPVEAFAILCRRPEHGGPGVEPAQQPVVDLRPSHPARLDAGIGQAANQAIAHDVQRLLGCLAATAGLARCAAIDHHAHAPALAAPRQARDHAVLEQSAGFGNGAQVVGERGQVELGEAAALGARLDVAAQRVQVLVEVGFVLGIELEHPRVGIELVETVLQSVFQCIARLGQPGGLAALGAQRRQLEESGNRDAVLKQHALRVRQVLDPWQQRDE